MSDKPRRLPFKLYNTAYIKMSWPNRFRVLFGRPITLHISISVNKRVSVRNTLTSYSIKGILTKGESTSIAPSDTMKNVR